MAKADIKAGRAYVELLLKQSAFEKGLRSAQKRLQAFGGEMQSIGRSIAMAGAGMLLPLGLSVKTFASFDDAMRSVKGVTQATTAEFEKLSKKAKDLGASTSFTAVEVAALMTELGRAGFNPDQIEKMTGAVLDLARATGTDAAVSSGIMAASIRQFGLDATEAVRVADSLTAAANKSFNTVESLGEALSYAGPVAADFGMDIESTLAVLGALGNVGIQGSNAGTAIRRLLTLSGAEAGKMKEVFGVEFLDAAGNIRPLIDTLGEVNDATKNLGSGERAKKFNEAFGLLGITGASAIGKAAVSAKELEKAIRAAGGTAAKTAADMDSGIGGAFRIMLSAVEGVAIAIGEVLNDSITTAAKSLTSLATATIQFIKDNATLIKTIAAVAAGLVAIGSAFFAVGLTASAVGVAISGLLAIIAMVKVAIIAAVGALGLVLGPIGLIVSLVRLAASEWKWFGDASRQAVTSVAESLSWMRSVFDSVWGGIVDAIASGQLELAMQIAWAGVMIVLKSGIAKMNMYWEDWKAFFLTVANEASSGIAGFFINAWADIKSTWLEAKDFFLDLFDVIATGASNAFRSAQDFLGQGLLKTLESVGVLSADEAAMAREDLTGRTSGRNAGAGAERDSRITEREQARAAAQAALEADRASGLDSIEQGRSARNAEIEANRVNDINASNQDAAAARANLDLLKKKAEEAANKTSELVAQRAAGDANTPTPGSGMSSPALAGRVLGSFSAGALLAGAGGGNAADRTAKASESAAEELKQIKKKTDELIAAIEAGGLVGT